MGNKGSIYERQICRKLSLWWTNNSRDDVFYRSDSSGARATSRNFRGRKTSGQYGDVAASDPVGEPLIDLFTIELKKGYSEDGSHGRQTKVQSLHTVLDRLPRTKPTKWEEFIFSAIENSEAAGSFSWLLISRRTGKQDIVFMDYERTWDQIGSRIFLGVKELDRYMLFPMNAFGIRVTLLATPLDEFLAIVNRKLIERMAEEL